MHYDVDLLYKNEIIQLDMDFILILRPRSTKHPPKFGKIDQISNDKNSARNNYG